MVTVLDRYLESSRRRRRRAERANYRLDIQGLRALAVLAVFAAHLIGWPRGGFVGIDVFFVIAGFFVSENLLRTTGETGDLPFRKFYGDRLRRIVPAATVVLILTVAASVFVLPPPGAREVGIDALFAFVFMANWHFAMDGTNVLAATDAVSPLQHYWPLSIEEQFYFVWPALIFVISLIAVREAWSHTRWLLLTGGVMGVIVVASLGWALYETEMSPAWAYLNTVARVWELGAGALLATAVGALSRIPVVVKPLLSWAGVGLISASMFLIDPGSGGFPAPWALLPVAGTAMVIASGVGGEPSFQGLLRNRVCTYLGDISYSLYLVHWPVLVLLGTMMATGVHYYACVLTLSFGLAIASYHFIDRPMRYASWGAVRDARRAMQDGLFHVERSTKIATVGALILLTVSVITYAIRPDRYAQSPTPAPCCVQPE